MEVSRSEQISNFFSLFLSLLKENDFESESRTKFYELLTKPSDSGVRTVRVECTLDGTPSEILEFLMEPKYLPMYDEMKEERILLEEGENFKLFLTKGKGKFMVDPRDTVVIFSWKIEDNGKKIIIAGGSVNHAGAQEVKGRVRAHSDVVGYELIDVGGGKTSMIWIGKLDPKGSVPTMVVNKMVGKQGEVFEKMNNVMKETKNKK